MQEGNPYLGVDCNDVGTNDMREQVGYRVMHAAACRRSAGCTCAARCGLSQPGWRVPTQAFCPPLLSPLRPDPCAHPRRSLSALTPVTTLAAPSCRAPLFCRMCLRH